MTLYRIAREGPDLLESKVFGQPMNALAELGMVPKQCQRVQRIDLLVISIRNEYYEGRIRLQISTISGTKHGGKDFG